MKRGDIVLYDNPQSADPRSRNLITMILNDFGDKHPNVIIRFWQTTRVVPKAHLAILPVSEFPIQVPERPCMDIRDFKGKNPAEYFFTMQELPEVKRIFADESVPEGYDIVSPGNQAGFTPIPLSWFQYSLPTLEATT